MAKIKVARQIRSINSDHLIDIPWKLAESIWEEIVTTRAESFHAWRTLAMAYPEDFNRPQFRYQLGIRQPSLPLPEYFRGITSSQNSWATSLRISPKQVSATDLIAISQIRNLAVLDLSDGQFSIDDTSSTFNERVMRTWAELADTGGSFRHLRVLLLGWQENVSAWIFKYLDSFPSLCVVVVTDCAQFHQRNRNDWEQEAHIYGWDARHAKKSAKSLKPILDDKDFYLGAVSGCYYSSQDMFEKLTNNRKPEAPARLPLIECSIGTPKAWTHIIDEFPSTRTVWLDNVKSPGSASENKDGIRTSSKTEPVKRIREVEVSKSKDGRSPPPKRSQGKLRPKANMKSATDLLAEFDYRKAKFGS